METFFFSLLMIFCLTDCQALGDSCIKNRTCTDSFGKNADLVECPLDARTKVRIEVELESSEHLDLDCPSISGICNEHNRGSDKCQRSKRRQLPDLNLLKDLYDFDNITHVEIRNFQLRLPGDFATIFPNLDTLELHYTDPIYERYGLFPVLSFGKSPHFSVFSVMEIGRR